MFNNKKIDMKITLNEANAIMKLLMIPAIEKAGVKRKSQCNSNFKLMRFDDLTAPVITDDSIKLKLDIKKSHKKMYSFMLEFRAFKSGQIGLVLDLTKGPVQNHRKAWEKLIQIVYEYDCLFQELNGSYSSEFVIQGVA